MRATRARAARDDADHLRAGFALLTPRSARSSIASSPASSTNRKPTSWGSPSAPSGRARAVHGGALARTRPPNSAGGRAPCATWPAAAPLQAQACAALRDDVLHVHSASLSAQALMRFHGQAFSSWSFCWPMPWCGERLGIEAAVLRLSRFHSCRRHPESASITVPPSRPSVVPIRATQRSQHSCARAAADGTGGIRPGSLIVFDADGADRRAAGRSDGVTGIKPYALDQPLLLAAVVAAAGAAWCACSSTARSMAASPDAAARARCRCGCGAEVADARQALGGARSRSSSTTTPRFVQFARLVGSSSPSARPRHRHRAPASRSNRCRLDTDWRHQHFSRMTRAPDLVAR